MNLTKQIDYTTLCGIIVILLLPFSKSLPNIFLGLGLLFVVYRLIKKDDVSIKPIVSFFLFFIFLVFTILIKGFIKEDYYMIIRIGIVILSSLLFLNSKKSFLINAFIIAINLTVLYSIIKMVVHLLSIGSIDLSNGETIYEILLLERPYMGFVVLISSLLTFDKIKNKKLNKPIGLAIIIINVLFIFLIAARLTMLTVTIIGFFYLLKYIKTNMLIKAISGLSIFILISAFYFLNENIRERFKLHEGYATFVDFEPRFVIWPCAYSILNENQSQLLIGPLGFKSGTNALKECYSKTIQKEDKKAWYVERGFNTHNQFLGILIVSGVLGLALFLNFIIQLFKYSYANFIDISIVFSLVLFFCLECLLYRQFGCYVVGLIIGLVSFKNEK